MNQIGTRLPPQDSKVQSSYRVLLIEDNPDDAYLVYEYLASAKNFSFNLEHATNLSEGLKILAAESMDVLLLDLSLPDSSGLEALPILQRLHSDLPIVIMTGMDHDRIAHEAVRYGVQDNIVKDAFSAGMLERVLFYAIERKSIQREMQRLASFPELDPNPVMEISPAAVVTYANTAARACFTELSQNRIPDWLLAQLNEVLSDMLTHGRSVETREILHNDVVYEERIQWLSAVGVFRLQLQDVSHRKKLEHMKDDFIGLASHELRKPLTIIIAGLASMRDGVVGAMTEKQSTMVDRIYRNADHMAKLISNLLNLTRLESRKASLNVEKLSVPDLLEEIQGYHQLALPEGGVTITVKTEADLPLVLGDRDLFIEVMDNLIDNALRFAIKGVVIVANSHEGIDAKGNKFPSVRVSVADDGLGIPADKIGELFNKFVQLKRAKGGSGYKGTGLGLSICKEIVENMGGTIWADPKHSPGACFHFTLPVEEK